jgi:serine phosphatase RsbU (regulator of sigma subunit)
MGIDTEILGQSMKDHFLYPLFCKLRPEEAKLDERHARQPFIEFFTVIYLIPFVLITLGWLFAASDFSKIITDLRGFIILFVSLLIIGSRTATIPIKLSATNETQATLSLGGILVWVGMFIWGPVALVFDLLVQVILTVQDVWQRSRYRRNAGWFSTSSLMQSISNSILPDLLGITVYTALGGDIPLEGVTLIEWIPAFVAIAASALTTILVLLPIILTMNKVMQIPVTRASISSVIFSVVQIILVTTPFAIPFTLLYTRASPAINTFATIGLVLVNLLLYYLARTNERSRQRTREMTQLEALGEEIIQAPADGSTLRKILDRHIEQMFQYLGDILEIRIFEGIDLPGFEGGAESLNFVYPATQAASSDSFWVDLQKTKEPHLIFKDVIPDGAKAIYGDAVIDKIHSAAPTDDGQEPACIGGVYLLRHKSVAKSVDALPAIQALASQIASALYRAQVHAETLQAHKMAQELEFAGNIQASFLPEKVPQIEGWGIAASLTPARQTAGDFYDFIPLGNDKLGIVVADVADKGTGAALYMALSRTLIRTYAMQYPDNPAEALRQTNERILEDTRANQFVTVFYAVLDTKTGDMIYTNAGHNPAFVIRSTDPEAHESFIRTGAPLGIFGDLQWEDGTTQVGLGDVLLLYTDGVNEAQNSAEEFFGYEHLLSVTKSNVNHTAEEQHAAIIRNLQTFVGTAPQFDDITLMVLKRRNGQV